MTSVPILINLYIVIKLHKLLFLDTVFNVIQLPWQYGFESGLGGMIQRIDDQFDWTRNRGKTPTRRTGPDAAAAGQWYIYIKASYPRTNGDVAV